MSKKRKRTSSTINFMEAIRLDCIEKHKALDLINQLDQSAVFLSTEPPNVTNEVGQALTVLKIGYDNVNRILSLMSQIPTCWPSHIRQSLIEQTVEWSEIAATLEKKGVKMKHALTWVDYFFPSTGTDTDLATHSYIGPPTGTCLHCSRNLQMLHKPITVTYVRINGEILSKKKISLRCTTCVVQYNYDKYGSRKDGFRFYDKPRNAIAATDTTFIERAIHNLQWSFAQHSWVSFEGFAESWHDAFNYSKEKEIDRRVWGQSFWWGELEEELRDTNKQDYCFFKDSDREECMRLVDKMRQKELYPHSENDCTTDCKSRGCGKLWVTDGIWKNQFAHCMYYVKNEVQNVPLINYPDVCTNEPVAGRAFCKYHCQVCENFDPPVPTKLREFLRYAQGDDKEAEEADTYDKITVASYSADDLAEDSQPIQPTSVISEQGGQTFLQNNGPALHQISQDCNSVSEVSRCHKDLGERKTLRKLSRGHQFVVRSGGHIDMWTPLYQSESVGQVFIFIISWLYLVLKDVPSSAWNQIWLAYDNMCQLMKLKAARKLLPLNAPYNKLWKAVNKIIDKLHIKNHVDKDCQTKLHPDRMLEMYPELKGTLNTQAAEQTFVWLGRFKKIMCSMPKTHHLFYLHRLVKRRNSYSAKCYRNGRKPVLPGIRNAYTK